MTLFWTTDQVKTIHVREPLPCRIFTSLFSLTYRLSAAFNSNVKAISCQNINLFSFLYFHIKLKPLVVRNGKLLC